MKKVYFHDEIHLSRTVRLLPNIPSIRILLRYVCLLCPGFIPLSVTAQFMRDIEYKIDKEKLDIVYLMDAVPSIHRPGWSYNVSVKVEGKILGKITSKGISGDFFRVQPNEFPKLIMWEVDNKDESLSDQLKVSLTLEDMDGPKAALKSLLVPGAGLKFVTARNQVGMLRTFSVYSLLAGGVITRLISRGLYDDYLTNPTDIFYQDTYASANFFHQASWFCFAAGIGVWTWDIFNTAARGRRNLKHLYRPVKVTPLTYRNGGAGMAMTWRISR